MRNEKEIREKLEAWNNYLNSAYIDDWEVEMVKGRIQTLRWVLYEL